MASDESSMTRRTATAAMLSLAGAGKIAALPPGRPLEPSPAAYAQAWLVEQPTRILFVSGQTPTDANGDAPSEFAAQARLAWRNVEAQLRRAGMEFANLVKVTIFLGDRRHRAENTRIRADMLGAATPAITVIIADIFDESWMIEIEAIACA
ncbi:RidA family protein [Allosphingosinicella deserti]|nr:RidA family protein [Sphingomonas deserti]